MDRRNPINPPSTPPVAPAVAPHASHALAVRRLGAPRAAGIPRDSGDGSRAALAAWLTAGRVARGLTREHVARVTRIQLRTIERLEDGRFDELPADVFVRGFIRNYARCVGLPVDEALTRYASCGFAAAPVASPQAQALLEAMAPLAPGASTSSSVVVVPAAPRVLTTEPPVAAARAEGVSARAEGASAAGSGAMAAAGSAPVARAESAAEPVAAAAAAMSVGKPRRVRDSRGRFVRKSEISAQIEALSSQAVADDELEVEITVADFVAAADELLAEAQAEVTAVAAVDAGAAAAASLERKVSAAQPVVTAPPLGEPARPVVTVRAAAAAPTLTIDDDDPDAADAEREARAERERDGGWRSFLPPALLDQDRGRQGGLTLAVIILLIVATLTLSYLMRRPSSTGEGVTARPAAPAQLA